MAYRLELTFFYGLEGELKDLKEANWSPAS